MKYQTQEQNYRKNKEYNLLKQTQILHTKMHKILKQYSRTRHNQFTSKPVKILVEHEPNI